MRLLLNSLLETRTLNQSVKCNIKRFPEHYRFQITREEYENLKSHFVISSIDDVNHDGYRKFHDRFLGIDGCTVSHIGASIKDAGKKCFGASLWQDSRMMADLLKRLKTVPLNS